MNPINPVHAGRSRAIRADFESDHPLPRFTVVPNFLRSELIEDALAGCKRASFETYCTYSQTRDGHDLKYDFREPEENAYYLTVHQRSRAPIPEVVRVKALLSGDETIATLNDWTGAAITRMSDVDVLTHWDPGSFLAPHTDDVPSTHFRLAITISLSKEWRPEYGGTAVYEWSGLDRCVRVVPHLNAAVLFAPFSGSTHWVEQISNDAAPLTRFTWTTFYL